MDCLLFKPKSNYYIRKKNTYGEFLHFKRNFKIYFNDNKEEKKVNLLQKKIM